MNGSEEYAPPKSLQNDLVSDKSQSSIKLEEIREKRKKNSSTMSELTTDNETELKIKAFADKILEESNKNSGNYSEVEDGGKQVSFLTVCDQYAPPKSLQNNLVSYKSQSSIKLEEIREKRRQSLIKLEEIREKRKKNSSTISELTTDNETELKIEALADNTLEEGIKNSGNYNEVEDGGKQVSFLTACGQDCEERNLPSLRSERTAPIFKDSSLRSIYAPPKSLINDLVSDKSQSSIKLKEIREERNKNPGNYREVEDGKQQVSFLTATHQDAETRNLPSWRSEITAPIFKDRSLRSIQKNIVSSIESEIKKFVEHGVFAIVAIVIAVILGSFPYFFGDIDRGTACDNNRDENTLIDICRLDIILRDFQKNLGTLVAFILGGFVSSTIYLWRLRRNNYCVLCGGARNLIIQIGAILPQANDEESFNRRKTMLRWVILGFELAVLKGRNMIDTSEGRYHLDYLGLLKWDEWDKLIDGDRHTTVWWWIQAKSSQLQSQGVISGLDKLHLCNIAAQMRDKANDLMSRIDRDESIPYTTIVGLLVNLKLANCTLRNGVHWAIIHYNSSGRCWSRPSMYFDVIFFVLYNIMFSMLFDLSQILYNPFGPRSIDISHNVVSRGIRKLAKEVAKCDFPSSMKSDNQIDSEEVFDYEPSNIIHKNRNPSIRKRFSLLGTMRNITVYE